MACNPPYCLGSGSYCGCNCNCCPPCPCYTSWTYVYLCGTSSSAYPAGCDCGPIPEEEVLFRAPKLDVEFPDFEYPSYLFKKPEDEYVFAQLEEICIDEEANVIPCPPGPDITTCSIPCTTVTITLTTSGCCLYGSGFSFTAIGAGTVSLSGCGPACEGNFSCSINGGGTSVSVADCGSVGVSITPPSNPCCSCCLVSSTGSLLGECSGSASFAAFKQRSASGGQKTYISKQKLLEKIRRTRRR